jgi:hypothetical protein
MYLLLGLPVTTNVRWMANEGVRDVQAFPRVRRGTLIPRSLRLTPFRLLRVELRPAGGVVGTFHVNLR